ncbi:MAG: aminopeptidase [Leptospiraceae bacterium]|nr:aminopeptidase [Leptospiraceae bacterium]
MKLLILILPLFLSNCIGYLLHLGKGQFQILYDRKEISKLINQTDIDSNQKEKLKLIADAREFALENLSLNKKGGFLYFTKLDRTEVGWHVTASYPLKFESYTWWFPIVGKVPYKGYFDLEEAKKLEDDLIKEGLDTRLRITAGYSTLGWFSDPVLSPQLRLRDDELVALVIHELSHATVYINGDSIFNESYASFVEEMGTKKFFETNFKEKSEEILTKRKKIQTENKYIISEMKKTGNQLKELYNEKITDEEKLNRKKEIIETFRETILSNPELQFLDKERYKKIKLNNESFIGVLRYASGFSFFQKKLEEVNGDFKKFHEEMEKMKSLTKQEREKLIVE